MDVLAQVIVVWGMAAVVLFVPTGLAIMWALCRTPSWNLETTETPKADETVSDAPNAITAKAA